MKKAKVALKRDQFIPQTEKVNENVLQMIRFAKNTEEISTQSLSAIRNAQHNRNSSKYFRIFGLHLISFFMSNRFTFITSNEPLKDNSNSSGLACNYGTG